MSSVDMSPKTWFLFGLLFLLGVGYVAPAGNSANASVIPRESLDFLLADRNTELGLKCLQYSQIFCLMGYWLNTKQSDREPQEDDVEKFTYFIRLLFEEVNWFSFKPQDQRNGGCCTYQTKLYIEYGQKNGLSPEEYLDKIFKFQRIGDKKLVFLKVRFHRQTCMNIINQIGFGKGDLKIIGARSGTKGKFAFPHLGNTTGVPVFYGHTMETRLTFGWFIINILCLEKPELCEPLIERRASSSSSSSGGN